MIDYVLVDKRFHNGAEFEVVYDHLDSDHLFLAEINRRVRDANGRPTAPGESEKFQAVVNAVRGVVAGSASLSTKL